MPKIRRCPLCQEAVGRSMAAQTMRQFLPDATDLDGVGGDDPDLDEHMAFGHGFNRAHLDNTTVVAKHYYRVVGEPIEIEGRTYKFGDMIEVKKGRVSLVVPGGIYSNNGAVKLSRKMTTRIG